MQFGYCLMVLANEHIGVGLQYGHIFGYIFDAFDTLSQNGLYGRVEIFVVVVNPLFHHTASEFIIVVVLNAQFAALLSHLQVNVGQWHTFGLWVKL